MKTAEQINAMIEDLTISIERCQTNIERYKKNIADDAARGCFDFEINLRAIKNCEQQARVYAEQADALRWVLEA